MMKARPKEVFKQPIPGMTCEAQVTASEALEALTSWSEFYHTLLKELALIHPRWSGEARLRAALQHTLNYPHNFMDKFMRQAAKELEVSRVYLSSNDIASLVDTFYDYYAEELNQ